MKLRKLMACLLVVAMLLSTMVVVSAEGNIAFQLNAAKGLLAELDEPLVAERFGKSTDGNKVIADLTREDLVAMAKEFAPVIYYPASENIWPSNFEVELANGTATITDAGVFFYNKKMSELNGTKDNLITAKTYVFCSEKNNGTIEISYWQYYPYDPSKLGIGAHYADWESCSVIFAKNEKAGGWQPVKFVNYRHAVVNSVSWNSGSLKKYNRTHPIVYCAKDNHGLYINQLGGTLFFDKLGSDVRWDTENHLSCFAVNKSKEVIPLSNNQTTVAIMKQVTKQWGQTQYIPGPLLDKVVMDPDTYDMSTIESLWKKIFG